MKNNKKPFFLITIDVEGDNLWSRPKKITTNNSNYLPRFQKLCKDYGFKPTYLVNYEMACCPSFKEFGLEIINNNSGEIGMHLHAWNNPPLFHLTKDDNYYQPYLIEYPFNIIDDKIKEITHLLEDTFNQKINSHRSGRWSFNNNYASSLIKQGYKIDCSVTPLRSWKNNLGDPKGVGGTDYFKYPNEAYWINSFEGGESQYLLEIPMTIISKSNLVNYFIKKIPIIKKITFNKLRKYFSPVWLRPNGNNLDIMKNILHYKLKSGADYAMLTLHSSELMPRGSPTFKTKANIEKLYYDLNNLFYFARKYFNSGTLLDYYNNYKNKYS